MYDRANFSDALPSTLQCHFSVTTDCKGIWRPVMCGGSDSLLLQVPRLDVPLVADKIAADRAVYRVIVVIVHPRVAEAIGA